MIINDPEIIEGLLHALNTGNQIFKNTKKDKSYLILRGKFIAIKDGYECSDAVGELKHPSTKKYHAGYDMIEKVTGYVSDGPGLYNYIKDFKKEVSEIELGKTYFKLSTRFGDVFESERDSTLFQNSVSYFKKYEKKIENITLNNNEVVRAKELTATELEEFLKHRYTTTLEIGKDKIIVTPKLFTSIKKASKLRLEVFVINKDTRLCKAILDNKDSTIRFTFAFSRI